MSMSAALKRLGIPTLIWARLFVLLAAIELVTIVSIEGYAIHKTNSIYQSVFGDQEPWGAYPRDVSISQENFLVYEALFVVAQVFLFYLCWDAVAYKNVIQIIATVLFNGLLCIYALIQFTTFYLIPTESAVIFKDDKDNKVLQISTIIIYFLCSIAFGIIGYEVYNNYGWRVYKKLDSANLKINRAYMAHQILITLLKLDVFFFISYSIQLATLVLKKSDAETYVQMAVVIPGSVIFLILVFYALHRENKWLMLFVIVCLGLSPIYFIYKFLRMYVNIDKYDDPYADTRKYLTFFIVTTFVLIIVTVANAWVCYRNFGTGLREAIKAYKNKKREIAARVKASNGQLTKDDFEYINSQKRTVLE
ncbi:hypothetical protein H4219_000790 [Mycoemilia scoparia]|uniref:Uncharacterized protein n=1 Tax=Mycoemilia scoparia TaxID=417184 RepID=A0A9W8A233_9FUNG|nr:hypothetical protein H4219_000790 [Mycoemilia scoparia]